MPEETITIKCVACGHIWRVELADLDKEYLVIFKGKEQQKEYRVPCPVCGTYNVVPVSMKETNNE